MTTPTLFKEYVWLVNTINQARSITLNDINKKWLKTEMSGGVELARSTFARHKVAIEEIFGSMKQEIEGDFLLEDLLIKLGAATSKREARTFITGNSVLINGTKVNDLTKVYTKADALYGKYLIVRRGKKNYYLALFA